MTISLQALTALYIAFAFKHLCGDFLLQTAWMARGKNCTSDWFLPLLAHAAIHAAGTLAIVLFVAPAFWWLALVDLVVHAAIDRTKALVACGWGVMEPRFWWAFGIDQFAHQVTHYVFLVVLLTR